MHSHSALLALICGLLIFGGACYVVATRQRPTVLAAFLVLLPLPVFIASYGVMRGVADSLSVIGKMPGIQLKTEEIAGATAASLDDVLLAILISAPSYFVVAYGLLARTLNPPTNSTLSALSPSQHREPLFNSSGTKTATT